MLSNDRQLARPAFTLVELMVVIVIIGLLAGAVSVSVRSYMIRGKQGVAQLEFAKLSEALGTFYTAYDRYPTMEEGLEILSRSTEQFPDGLLGHHPVDPWGNAYEYNQPGRNRAYEVICYGADAAEGGTGADKDITSDLANQRDAFERG